MTLIKPLIAQGATRLRVSLCAAALMALMAPVLASAAPFIRYSDLVAAPNTGGANNAGAWVTVYGSGFGSARGTGSVTVGGGAVASYLSWTDTKVVFQLGASARTGNIMLTDASNALSNGVPFTVRAGRIVEATTANVGNAINALQSGDVVYLRGGSYTGRYGATGWGSSQFTLGGSASNSAIVGYPGEIANVRDFRLDDGSSPVNDLTIANLTMVGDQQCIHGGAWTGDPRVTENGAARVRVVANDCRATYSNNTMTGMMSAGNDGWKFLGNYLHDTGTSPPINNNHAIYIQVGADDMQVAWNRFERLRMGHVVQVHTDGDARQYDNIRIHDNEFTGANPADMRGVVSGNVSSTSTLFIYNNIFRNLGQDVSAVMITAGTVVVEHNTFDRIQSQYGALRVAWSTSPRPIARNNIINPLSGSQAIGATDGSSMGQWQLFDNKTGVQLLNDRPTSALTGSAPTVLIDHAGKVRSNPPTVGAYELGGTAITTPKSPQALTAQ